MRRTDTPDTHWVVTLALPRGYELPSWHRPEHATPEGAHTEAEKLAGWAGVPLSRVKITYQ